MKLLKPFKAIRPTADIAADMLAPPYDVVSREEAYQIAHNKPFNFLHVSRPEIDLAADIDPYADAVYQRGLANFQALLQQGSLMQDGEDSFYIYRLTQNGKAQTGIVASFSVAAYNENHIRRHELTRPKKENDRIQHISTLHAQASPVLLTHKPNPTVKQLCDQITQKTANYDITDEHQVQHQFWVINDPQTVEKLSAALNQLTTIYIADGHHRSAAAAKVAAANPNNPLAQYFLGVTYPADELTILGYHRILFDLNQHSAEEIVHFCQQNFTVTPLTGAKAPTAKGEFSMYLAGQWYSLTIQPDYLPSDDPVKQLDVSLLHDLIIKPLFDIHDPRNDERIDFVGGVRGLTALEKAVQHGPAKIAFALHPTALTELFAVADQGQMMPPKSTWFEPKLGDGLVAYQL